MKLVRASWFLTLAVIIITAALPMLRHQFHFGFRFLLPGKDLTQQLDQAVNKIRKPYSEDPAAFVKQRYPDDTEMLLAAGVVKGDLELLQRAAEKGNSPIAWSAYVEQLMQNGPSFGRVGSSGVDPADAKAVAEEKKRLADSGIPDRITPEQAEPILSALRSWQEADPENGLPVALEARILYGLHQDQEALRIWAQAGRMPLVTSHALARANVVKRLYVARGMPEPEALLTSQVLMTFPSFARLRDAARFAVYEGRLALLQDDPTTAINWWQSTANFGRHLGESSDTIIGFLVGVAIEGIGAGPVWRWVPDGVSRVPNGPLFGGRYFWGDHHSLYVEYMGKDNEQALINNLVLAKLRSMACREYTSELGMFEGYYTAARYLGLTVAAAGLAAIFFLFYLLFGAWSRHAADSATNLYAFWQFVLAAILLLPFIVAVIIILRLPLSAMEAPPPVEGALLAAAIGFLLLLLVIPPLATISTRAPGARFRTAWRGNLRRLLPVSLALCLLVSLGFNLYAMQLRRQWVNKWSKPNYSEFKEMVTKLGPKWTNPTIPSDAYRAEYPPEPSAQ